MSEIDSLLSSTQDDVNLSDVTNAVEALFALEHDYELKEKELAEIKAMIEHYKTKVIPELCGNTLPYFETPSGLSVQVTDFVRANIKKEDTTTAYDWLDNNGHGDLIKTKVELEFTRGHLREAKDLVKELQENKLFPILKQDVHFQTLQAWVREQMQEGQTLPEFFNVYSGKTTKVKQL